MARRRRCAKCKKAFTPDPRNRTKIKHRQRVCHDCGPVSGNLLAVRRCRARKAELGRSGRPARPAAVPFPPDTGPQISPLAGELVRRIQQTCTALSALVGDPVL
jgi:hypothetical protein